MNKVYLALGSNLGNKKANIVRALHLLSRRVMVLKISKFYETTPVGYKNQENFINAVIKAETLLSPRELLQLCHNVESHLKRERTIKGGPRTIDVDIILYNNKIIQEKDLIIPHPRFHKRKFVLQPLLDINPELEHPINKKTITQLYAELPTKHCA